MKVLVTGANGHIGCHVVKQLQDDGHEVRAFVRPNSDRRGLEGLSPELAEGDIRDANAVSKAATGVDAIIHMAAVYKTMGADADSIVEPAIQGAKAVFNAAREHGIQRVVYTSSVASVGFSYDPQTMLTSRDWNTDPPQSLLPRQDPQRADRPVAGKGVRRRVGGYLPGDCDGAVGLPHHALQPAREGLAQRRGPDLPGVG